MCVAHVVVDRLVNVVDNAVLNVRVNGSVDIVVYVTVHVDLRVCGTGVISPRTDRCGDMLTEARWLGSPMLVLVKAFSTALDTPRTPLTNRRQACKATEATRSVPDSRMRPPLPAEASPLSFSPSANSRMRQHLS